jgi:hypothetical protein
MLRQSRAKGQTLAKPRSCSCICIHPHCSSFREWTIFAASVTLLTRYFFFVRRGSDSRRTLQERAVLANAAGAIDGDRFPRAE